MGKFEEGAGSEEEATLVKLKTGNNALYENEHSGETLSPEDILSSKTSFYISTHVKTQVLDMENRNMSEGYDWLKKIHQQN